MVALFIFLNTLQVIAEEIVRNPCKKETVDNLVFMVLHFPRHLYVETP